MGVKKAFYGRKRNTRSRLGCTACKKSKVKCDGMTPTCERCADRQIKCSWDLKLTWPRGNNGTHISRQSVPDYEGQCKVANRIEGAAQDIELDHDQRVQFINTTFADFGEFRGRSPSSDDAHSTSPSALCERNVNLRSCFPSECTSPLAATLSPLQVKMSPSDTKLFQHYARSMCPRCNLFDGRNTSYRAVVIPIALSSPLVFTSVLAASANSLRLENISYRTSALGYRQGVIRSLNSFLGRDTSTLPKTEIMATILMICLPNIVDEDHSFWEAHIEGARHIVELAPKRPLSPIDEALLSFLGQYFAARATLMYTTTKCPTREPTLLRNAIYWQSKVARPNKEINCFLGCSNELANIILEICAWIKGDKKAGEINSKTRYLDLKGRLQDLEHMQTTSAETAVTGRLSDDVVTNNFFDTTPETFRLAALILLEHFEENSTPHLLSRVLSHAQTIIRIMKPCLEPSISAKSSAVWPLFIAACHVSKDEDRLEVLHILHDMSSKGKFGRAPDLVQKTVQCLWNRRDLMQVGLLSDQDGIQSRSQNVCFEWEQVMMDQNLEIDWD